MPASDLGKALIIIGVIIAAAGVLFLVWPHLPLPGRLPGDLTFQRGNLRVFVPLATSIALSLILTVVINVVLRLFK